MQGVNNEREKGTFSRAKCDFGLGGVVDHGRVIEWSVVERKDCQRSASLDWGVTLAHG
jgi:hypothetical protein